MEEKKGGQQFFSNYLKAFKETVDRQTDIVTKLENIYTKMDELVPKYAMASNVVRKTKTINRTMNNQDSIIENLTSFLNGEIKIAVTGKGATIGGGFRVEYFKNGVSVASSDLIDTTTTKTVETVIGVVEGDEIILKTSALGGGGAGKTITVESIQIKYDLIPKPDIVI